MAAVSTLLDCWLLAFFPTLCFGTSTFITLLFMALLFFLAWLAAALLYWSYPGGPAWGRLRWNSSSVPHHITAKPIPGPRGLPVLGSMSLMSGLSHRRLAAASCGFSGGRRLMAFSVGCTRVVITSDPDVAKEILHGPAFADRPIKESAYRLMFNRAIGFAPYGAYWRTLRRISASHLFCPKQIAAGEVQRSDVAAQMVEALRRGGRTVRVREILRKASLCYMMELVFGKKYNADASGEEVAEVREMVEEGYELLGTINWSDHLPFLARLDPQMVQLRCSHLVPRVTRFLSQVIAEHRAKSQFVNRDFVDVLLALQGPDKLSDPDIIAVLWEMIFRGTDTMAVLIEWILARLVLHPNIQSKIHGELDRVVGRSNRVTESDLPSLKYLHAVIKEVLRLHPPGPLLSWARLSTADTIIDGRLIPAGTTAMVNMWAISRDPSIWSDPLTFCPDRFMSHPAGDGDFSVLGSDLRLAPFGSGRRSCPGKALGLATTGFWVATLLHEFNWAKLKSNPVNLSESMRLSCEMKEALTASLHPRRTAQTV